MRAVRRISLAAIGFPAPGYVQVGAQEIEGTRLRIEQAGDFVILVGDGVRYGRRVVALNQQ